MNSTLIVFELAQLMKQSDQFSEVSVDGDNKSAEVFFVHLGQEYVIRSASVEHQGKKLDREQAIREVVDAAKRAGITPDMVRTWCNWHHSYVEGGSTPTLIRQAIDDGDDPEWLMEMITLESGAEPKKQSEDQDA